jgi:hypothetical protein
MARKKRIIDADEGDRPTSWLRGYKSGSDLREFFELNLISYSLEGLVRFDTNKGSVQEVEVTERSVAEALVRISDYRMDKDFMIFALQAVAQALFGLDDGHRLDLVQSRTGRQVQLPERIRKLKNQDAIVADIEAAIGRGEPSPCKQTANRRRVSDSTITRARRAVKQRKPAKD